jgi:hypothetical protein
MRGEALDFDKDRERLKMLQTQAANESIVNLYKVSLSGVWYVVILVGFFRLISMKIE